MQPYCHCRLFLILSLTAAMLLTSRAEKSPNTIGSPDAADAVAAGEGAAAYEKGSSSNWNANEKRNWNKLQGLWGKRALDSDLDSDVPDAEGGWLDPNQALSKRNWNQIKGLWGKRSDQDEAEDLIDDEDDDSNEVKRAWNQLHGVWGKRAWNRLQGVWGKRSWQDDDLEQMDQKRAWNQLHGVWGKRSGRNDLLGNELAKKSLSAIRGILGKRELLALAKGNELSRKRETNWNNLKGLWG